MSAEILNFKAAKKRAGYAQKKARASENRTKFGRTKAEKNMDTLRAKRTKSHIDGHKLIDE